MSIIYMLILYNDNLYLKVMIKFENYVDYY